MLMAPPPPGYSPNAMNRQTVSPLAAPGVQSTPVQGQALQPSAPGGYAPPAPGASSYSPPSTQLPQLATPPSAARGSPWGALGPQNLNNIVRTLGGAKVR